MKKRGAVSETRAAFWPMATARQQRQQCQRKPRRSNV